MGELYAPLALEAAEQLGLTGPGRTVLEGATVGEALLSGYAVTTLRVTTEAAAERLGRAVGRYVTVDLRPYFLRRERYFPRGVAVLRRELTALLPPGEGCVLVVGLGNRRLACDAVGPRAVESLLVTRHLPLPDFAPVAALTPGVVGETGVETAELVASAVERLRPKAVIVVDALCARARERLCATVQLSDTGLVPGAGVGNRRAALEKKTLGVPVVAVGVPTVMAGSTLARELTGAGTAAGDDLFVTPRDVSDRVAELGRLVGYGITAALQPSLTVEDITGLLS